MGFLDSLKRSAQDLTKSMTDELTKFRSKDLMHAIVAGAAMIAYADGEVSASEKQKLMGYVRTSDQLKVFESDKVIAAFNDTLGKFEFDTQIGAGEALKKIAPFKGKPEAQLIVRVCLAIANADGKFETSERKALEQICGCLALDANTFLS